MQFQDEKAFTRALAAKPLPPAILVAGVDELRVIEAGDAVRAKARREGFERSTYEVEGRFDWDRLVGDFSEMSLFASARLLDLRMPEGKVGKDGSAVIAGFCKDPPPGTTLLVSFMPWRRDQAAAAWVKAIAAVGHVLAMWALDRSKLPEWVQARLRARGIEASQDAAMLLAERVEGNLLAAAQEVDKLALLLAGGQGAVGPDGARIDVATMERLVADAARFDVFKLVDASLAGDTARALRIVRALRAEGETVPALLGAIASQLRALAELAADAAGGGVQAAMQARGIWEFRQALYRRALERHDFRQWETFAIEVGRIDRIAKGRGEGDAWVALERLLAAVATPRARRLLEA